MKNRRILLGAVAGPHGVRGEVRIRTFTAEEENIAAYGPLTDETGARRLTILSARVSKPGMIVARCAEVKTREDAEKLAGLQLYAPREALPELADEEEFYVADLVGLEATTDEGRALGRVTQVHNFGAGDLLEIKGATGGALLTPLTLAAVPVVDVAGGRIVVAEAALREISVGSGNGRHADERKPPELDSMREEDA